ncbi:alpha/beta hydrolase [Actinomadura nitritigenes]|uniref:alpha/beta hydrolase n=1 Tax=Actinomadura nitritigenes TaxID=134602 RepID=UPI003D8DBF22
MSGRTPPAGGCGRARPPFVPDPLVRSLLDASAAPPYLHEIGPVDGRLALLESQGNAPDDPRVEAAFHAAPVGPSGLTGLWIFRPAAVPGPLPTVLYLHGGRWMLGDAHTHWRLISALVKVSGAAFVVPEYTRTPEARYPVAIEECYAVLEWAARNAGELALRGDRIAVAGDCAGATMATALAMLAKRRGGPRLRAQLLYYAMTDPRCDSDSQEQFAEGHLLTRAALKWYWRQYGGGERELAEPVAAPSRATADDLAGLPPTLIVSAEGDIVRDEAEQYARHLRRAGVAVTSVRYLGMVHDFVSLATLEPSPSAHAAIKQGGSFVAEALSDRPHDRLKQTRLK